MVRIKTIRISRKDTKIYNLRRERGYVSIRNEKLGYYHKFFYREDFSRWIIHEKINYWWGNTVYEILRRSKKKTPLKYDYLD